MLTLTTWENYSITAGVTKTLAELNQPKEAKYLIITAPTARIAGVVLIPLAAIGDAFAHLTSATGKILTGVIVSPYNSLAVVFFPDGAISIDYELSSALVHVIRVIQSLFDGVVLPFICLLNPARAHQYMQHRLGEAPAPTLSRAQLARELNEVNEAAIRTRQIEELKRQIRLAGERRAPIPPQSTLPVSNPSTMTSPFHNPRQQLDMATPLKRVDQHRQMQTSIRVPLPTPTQTPITMVHTPIPQPPTPPQPLVPQPPMPNPTPMSTTAPTIPGRPAVIEHPPSSSAERVSMLEDIKRPGVPLKKAISVTKKDDEILKNESLVYLVLEALPKVGQLLNLIESKLQSHAEGDFFAFTQACEIESDDSWDDESDDESKPQPLPMLPNGSYPIEFSLENQLLQLLQNAISDKVVFSHAELKDLGDYYLNFKKEMEKVIKLKSRNPETPGLREHAILISHGLNVAQWNSMVQRKDFSNIEAGN